MKVRIKFSKYGAMKFIGHLDIMRYFQKAFRRADIDIAYSQGFNPHQLMSFAAPLGVGITSDGEYLDVQLNSCDGKEVMIDRLNAEMVYGIDITDFSILDDKCKNSMSLVAAADYKISLKDGYNAEFESFKNDFAGKFSQFYNQDFINIVKKSKKSEKEVDIKPLIYDITFEKDNNHQTVAEKFDNGLCVYMSLACGSEENLKPELVMEAFCNYLSLEFNKFAYQIHRIETYAKDNEELIPLSKKDVINE